MNDILCGKIVCHLLFLSLFYIVDMLSCFTMPCQIRIDAFSNANCISHIRSVAVLLEKYVELFPHNVTSCFVQAPLFLFSISFMISFCFFFMIVSVSFCHSWFMLFFHTSLFLANFLFIYRIVIFFVLSWSSSCHTK